MPEHEEDNVDVGASATGMNVPSSYQTSDYFTSEIRDEIMGMNEKEMYRELRNLIDTRAWIAILKYNNMRMSYSQSAIFSSDPVKEPTNIARHQGIMLGLSDLQNAVILLNEQVEDQKKEAE